MAERDPQAGRPPLLEVRDLARHYRLPREQLWRAAPVVRAVDGVDLRIGSGRHLGIVGESGSGKSTLARTIMALERPTRGSIHLLGEDLFALDEKALRVARRHFQMVFQDPYGSLDPRQTVARIVGAPLDMLAIDGAESRRRVIEALGSVGLREGDLDRYPHEFSGGQRQRIAIARALVTRPRLIVADEPVSALDVSVQAQVLNLLEDLARDHGLTYLLISHDLAVVDHLCDEVAVLYQGRIVEQGPPATLFAHAAHPYTRLLLAAVPRIDRPPAAGPAGPDGPTGSSRSGRPLRPGHGRGGPPGSATTTGCAFAPRCPMVGPRCRVEAPVLRTLAIDHQVACHEAGPGVEPGPGQIRLS